MGPLKYWWRRQDIPTHLAACIVNPLPREGRGHQPCHYLIEDRPSPYLAQRFHEWFSTSQDDWVAAVQGFESTAITRRRTRNSILWNIAKTAEVATIWCLLIKFSTKIKWEIQVVKFVECLRERRSPKALIDFVPSLSLVSESSLTCILKITN